MDEIQDLFLSGIASAKGGNRRLAQAFFKRVIRKNPLHEGAWVWLAEMLDDPDDIAYCLESALEINPDNEKARRDLEVVRDQGAQPRRPREWSSLDDLLDMDISAMLAQNPPLPVTMAEPIVERDPFQGFWRVALFSFAVLAVLALSVAFAVGLFDTHDNNPAPPPTAVPTIDVSSLREQERLQIRSYFQELDLLLGPLRLAHDVYRNLYWGRNSPPLSMAEQIEQTAQLKVHILATLESLQEMEVPTVLEEAHEEHVQGLQMEKEALDSMLRYMETMQTGYSHQAMVKFQEAEIHLERAKAIWAAYREWAGLPEPTRLPTPTPEATPTFGPTASATPTFPPRPTATETPLPTQPSQ